MSQKNLILPEKVVIDLMALTSRLGEIAIDYNNKIGLGHFIRCINNNTQYNYIWNPDR